ncbi:MAG TPA: glycosyl transferase family 1 [Treponema sp.]|uniref:glycosyltransferase n=1 Tax=Treponema sp. UBA7567 TaxID=1947748 RepID=UPI000E865D37|nr:glycosyltransferase [Treponema sp. UBA7567]HAZ96118.1 glycosyl transferase family 1 [Treponema sp.]
MKSPLSILYITAFPPNQKTAGQDYSRRLLDDLVSRGHKISLIYAEYPEHKIELSPEIKVLAKIKPAFKNCLSLPFFNPFFTKRFDKSILRQIQKIAANFDMLYFDFSQVHIYSLFVKHPNKVLMCHDVICQKFSRKGKLFLPWIKSCEKKLLCSAEKIITFSPKDCDVIKKEYGLDSTAVNFYLKNGRFDYEKSGIEKIENKFCFYGAWNRAENSAGLEWFLENVYPNLSASEDFQFAVIGGGMTEHLKSKISAYKNFKILGFVENPVMEIAKCQALVAPLFKGAGVKVKVIDALSSGTPVIGTEVAFEGIQDNSENPLFFEASTSEKKKLAQKFADILNNWKSISAKQKQSSADEFFERYNRNKFADLL